MFLLHVPALLAVVVAVLLGNWQLGAWQMHREARTAELTGLAPVPLQDVLGPDDPFPGDGVGRPVQLSGRWLPQDVVHVSGRQHEGSKGFWTVVPLLTCGTVDCAEPSAIPVVLGRSTTVAAAPEAPTGTGEVTGWLQPSEGSAPDDDPDDEVLPALRVADLAQRVEEDLYGGFVILESPAEARGAAAAVTPESLPEAPSTAGLRNFLYGIEWWLFAGFAVFLWWRWTRDEVLAARERSAGVTPVAVATDDDATATSPRIPSET
jgi:cytochrome oxidase assembly protein ShyY1